jgi:glycosyltransferase involved in cell wall biosynthesis
MHPLTGSPPRVSVVMPVLNGAQTVVGAIRSVLDQSFQDFELIVVNDGSTDQTASILAELAATDQRLQVITHDANQGLVASLNQGIELASGQLIARLDSDDLAYPHRFGEQVSAFDRDPELVLCATGYERINPAGEVVAQARPPLTHAAFAAALLGGNCVCHSSVMFQRSAARAVGGYRSEWFPVEDYDLWLRLIGVGHYIGLPTIHVGYLVNPLGVSSQNGTQQLLARQRMLQYLSSWAGVTAATTVANTLDGDFASSAEQRLAIQLLQRATQGIEADLRQRGIDCSDLYQPPRGVGLQVLRHRGRLVRQLNLLTAAPRLATRGRQRRSS